MTCKPSEPELKAELEDLRARLAEAEELLRAIRNGEVDALLVNGKGGELVYTLSGADRIYRQLIETMSEGAVTLSADGVILFGNGRLAEMLERPLDQLLGTALVDYLQPADRHELDATLTQAQKAPSRLEINLKTRKGRMVPLRFSAFRLHSEGADMVFCLVLTDLTDQKNLEQIAKAERLARLILEQAAESIVVCDKQGLVIRASLASHRFCDGSPLNRPFSEAFPLRNGASGSSPLAAVLQGETLRDLDVAMDRQARTFDFLMNAGPLLCDRQILGCVVTLTDITDRKQAEEKLRVSEDKFHQAQKMEAIGRLAGGVAHDFNNMLTIILGYGEMALGNADPTSSVHANLQQILKAGYRSAGITQQILAFARKQPIVPVCLDLNGTITDMLKMLRRLIGENIELIWKPSADPMPVKMDPSQVGQILANLTVNARDAILSIGRITIETGQEVIDEAFCSARVDTLPGRYIRLAVGDDGCGMDKETMTHLFEPFFTTKPIGEGTGLGLATMFGIVKQNRGFIDVKSLPAKGSVFSVYIPRDESLEIPSGTMQKLASPPRGTETVLIVEDEIAVLNLGRMMLEILGYRVLAANGPEQALKLVAEYKGDIHLLLTDMVMPKMNGRELQKRIFAVKPEMKILFMSGYASEFPDINSVPGRSVHFLQKPFSLQSIGTKLREALSA